MGTLVTNQGASAGLLTLEAGFVAVFQALGGPNLAGDKALHVRDSARRDAAARGGNIMACVAALEDSLARQLASFEFPGFVALAGADGSTSGLFSDLLQASDIATDSPYGGWGACLYFSILVLNVAYSGMMGHHDKAYFSLGLVVAGMVLLLRWLKHAYTTREAYLEQELRTANAPPPRYRRRRNPGPSSIPRRVASYPSLPAPVPQDGPPPQYTGPYLPTSIRFPTP